MRQPRSLAILGLLSLSACTPAAPGLPLAAAEPVPAQAARVLRPDCAALNLKPSDQAAAVDESVQSGPETVEKAEAGKRCQIADDNLAAAGRAIVAQADARKRLPARAVTRWNGSSRLLYEDRIDSRYALSDDEKARLRQHGFFVADRLSASTYGWAFHELYQSQIPIYVSADAILHAIYAANDKLLALVESERLSPLLQQVLRALHCALADQAPRWPAEVARDADVYLTVARSLLNGSSVPSVLGSDGQVQSLLAAIAAHQGLRTVEIFGRARVIDFAAFAPRGHYEGRLAAYFSAAMWLSRVELNLLSRACRSSQPGNSLDPSETPREAALALGLTELVDRAGASDAIALLDRAWGLFAGRREDVSLAQLSALRKQAGLAGAPSLNDTAKLRTAIGSGYRRSARLFPMPEGIKDSELPVVSTFLGPRIVPDTAAIHGLVHDAIAGRHLLHAADVAVVLGHDRARSYLQSDLSQFAALDRGLTQAGALLDRSLSGPDLYSIWLTALRGLAQRPEGVVPSFMQTPAFADLRINSTIAGFAQLRHNNVLLAGQEYGAAGCEIPDGYVDPVPRVYEALIEYGRRGDALMAVLDTGDALGARAYFTRLRQTLRVLHAIAEDELAGRALSDEQRRFLSMVAEFHPPNTGGPATYSGWYFDLFRSRREEGLSDAALIADYYTSGETQQVAHVGVTAPRLGFFAVDTGGPPRLFVGPVARAFEAIGTSGTRFRDAQAETVAKIEPWAASYRVAGPPEPPLAVDQEGLDFSVRSSRALGPVTLTAMDHHRRPLKSVTQSVGTKPVLFRFGLPKKVTMEAVRVRVGTFTHVAVAVENAVEMSPIRFTLGGMAQGGDDGASR